MPTHSGELLATARLLITRRAGSRGRLSQARIRRAISTAYYAMFHFLLDESAKLLVGTGAALLTRRRIFVRQFVHKGMLTTLNKMSKAHIDSDIVDFLRSGTGVGPLPTPAFVREVAGAFADAQTRRHDADYDLNATIVIADAQFIIDRVSLAIDAWNRHTSTADREFKRGIALLLLLKGSLRKETA